MKRKGTRAKGAKATGRSRASVAPGSAPDYHKYIYYVIGGQGNRPKIARAIRKHSR